MTGARVDDVLEHQLPALESLGVTPAMITLLAGSNDLFRRGGRAGLAERWEQVLQRLPSTTVVVGTLPNPSSTARALNRVTVKVSAERGFVVADTRRDPRTTFWAGKLAADRFHPNDRGYAAIAAVFADALQRS